MATLRDLLAAAQADEADMTLLQQKLAAAGWLQTHQSTGHTWIASATGSPTGAGTVASPWDTATALSGAAGDIVAGDTIQCRGGSYGTGTETFTSTLSGSASKPIILTNFPGERVTWNILQFALQGQHTRVQCLDGFNFELKNSLTGTQTGTDLIRMQEGGDGNKLIHLTIHDALGVGINMQSETADHEAYGNIIFNCGRDPVLAPTYGHGIYPHGTTTVGQTRKILNNILFNQVGYGYHLFADSGNLQRFDCENNIGLMNGLGNGYDFLIGGQTALSLLQFLNNVGLRTDGNTVLSLGLLEDDDLPAVNLSGTATGNYMHGSITINNWDGAALTWSNNTGVGSGNGQVTWRFQGATNFTNIVAASNVYACLANEFGIFAVTANADVNVTEYSDFASYVAGIAREAGSTYTAADNIGTKVVLLPSTYDAKRAHLGIDNPSSASTVAVDISPMVAIGGGYSIWNVYDEWGTPALTGTYAGGTVAVPMTGKTPPGVTGNGFTPNNANPKAGAFVLRAA